MKKLSSPYWSQGYNPNFPFGCTKEMHQRIHQSEIVLIQSPTKISTDGIRKRHRDELKRAKAECVNKNNLTTIIKIS